MRLIILFLISGALSLELNINPESGFMFVQRDFIDTKKCNSSILSFRGGATCYSKKENDSNITIKVTLINSYTECKFEERKVIINEVETTCVHNNIYALNCSPEPNKTTYSEVIRTYDYGIKNFFLFKNCKYYKDSFNIKKKTNINRCKELITSYLISIEYFIESLRGNFYSVKEEIIQSEKEFAEYKNILNKWTFVNYERQLLPIPYNSFTHYEEGNLINENLSFDKKICNYLGFTNVEHYTDYFIPFKNILFEVEDNLFYFHHIQPVTINVNLIHNNKILLLRNNNNNITNSQLKKNSSYSGVRLHIELKENPREKILVVCKCGELIFKKVVVEKKNILHNIIGNIPNKLAPTCHCSLNNENILLIPDIIDNSDSFNNVKITEPVKKKNIFKETYFLHLNIIYYYIGFVLGVLFLLILISSIVIFFMRRRLSNNKNSNEVEMNELLPISYDELNYKTENVEVFEYEPLIDKFKDIQQTQNGYLMVGSIRYRANVIGTTNIIGGQYPIHQAKELTYSIIDNYNIKLFVDLRSTDDSQFSYSLSGIKKVKENSVYRLLKGKNDNKEVFILKLKPRIWPDRGVTDVKNLKKIFKTITKIVPITNNRKINVTETIFVHCLAGVGRTGTFISLLLLNYLKEYFYDVPNTILYVRKFLGRRAVQTEEQYKFILDNRL